MTMHINANPKTKAEAIRWLKIGIELVVIDATTDRPIAQKDGRIEIAGPRWNGKAILRNGLVFKIE
jgi:hypothetical protein